MWRGAPRRRQGREDTEGAGGAAGSSGMGGFLSGGRQGVGRTDCRINVLVTSMTEVRGIVNCIKVLGAFQFAGEK